MGLDFHYYLKCEVKKLKKKKKGKAFNHETMQLL